MARGTGNVAHFWNVWPLDRFASPNDFYQKVNARVSAEEVVEILRREGLAR